jgi:23S rRNA (pseudouridine1915-N3)-methyltransferase
MPAWTVSGSEDYIRRLPKAWGWRLVEHTQARGDTAAVRKSREADALIAALDPREYVILLDEGGRLHTTTAVAGRLEHWQTLGKTLAFVIGGPDGMDERLRQRADERWSLSPLTFPHPLVRVLLAEQLYRACSLNAGHPYHRE